MDFESYKQGTVRRAPFGVGWVVRNNAVLMAFDTFKEACVYAKALAAK